MAPSTVCSAALAITALSTSSISDDSDRELLLALRLFARQFVMDGGGDGGGGGGGGEDGLFVAGALKAFLEEEEEEEEEGLEGAPP